MALHADLLLERLKQKRSARRWRNIAIVITTLALILILQQQTGFSNYRDHIARITIEGLITSDRERLEGLRNLAQNDNVKALIIHLESPGGTTVGAEELYDTLKTIRETKPIGMVMHSMATSGAYLTAMAGDYVVARKGTLTGSIGVMMQIPDVSGLSGKVGLQMNTIRTGTMKGEPDIFQPMRPEVQQALTELADDFYNVFMDIVAKERNLEKSAVRKIADGRAYTGRQALDLGLIDAIGDESTVIKWLNENKTISADLPVVDTKLKPDVSPIEKLFQNVTSLFSLPTGSDQYGLLSVWKSNAIQ